MSSTSSHCGSWEGTCNPHSRFATAPNGPYEQESMTTWPNTTPAGQLYTPLADSVSDGRQVGKGDGDGGSEGRAEVEGEGEDGDGVIMTVDTAIVNEDSELVTEVVVVVEAVVVEENDEVLVVDMEGVSETTGIAARNTAHELCEIGMIEES